MSILIWFWKKLYFWNENKKLDWMNQWNVKNLIKILKANVMQFFAFAFHIVSNNVEGKPKWSRKSHHNVSGIPLTMWRTNLNEDTYCLETNLIKDNLIFYTYGEKLTVKILGNIKFCVLKVKRHVSFKSLSKIFWKVSIKCTMQSKKMTAEIHNVPNL